MKPSLAALFAVLLMTTACPKPSPPATSILHGLVAATAALGSVAQLIVDHSPR
jgi:hypothetical protein